ncbi:MAG: DUF1631 family protein, partial [Gammaproteobacteria bacterium]
MSVHNQTASSLSELLLESADGGARTPAADLVVAALHELTLRLLGQYLGEMFDAADDILFGSVEKAKDGAEQRLYLDSMRTVRVQRGRIIPAFQDALGRALSRVDEEPAEVSTTALDDMSHWSLEDGDALEERLALNSIEARATAACATQYEALRSQLARLAVHAKGRISEESMAPARIVRSFRDAMKDLVVEAPVKLVVYKLFERVVVSRFPELFGRAGSLLAENGIEPAESAPSSPRAARGAGRPARPP